MPGDGLDLRISAAGQSHLVPVAVIDERRAGIRVGVGRRGDTADVSPVTDDSPAGTALRSRAGPHRGRYRNYLTSSA